MLDTLCTQLIDRVHASRVCVFLTNSTDSEQPAVELLHDSYDKTRRSDCFQHQSCKLAEWIVEHSAEAFIPDAKVDERIDNKNSEFEISCLIGIPLYFDECAAAVSAVLLAVNKTDGSQYDAVDFETLLLVANQADYVLKHCLANEKRDESIQLDQQVSLTPLSLCHPLAISA